MAPSAKKLEAALIDGTCEVFKVEPDATSVNKVRKQVEESLGLEDGFFQSEEWKSRSKSLIKHYVEKLLDGWSPDDEEGPESKNGIKRQSPESGSPDRKRRKRDPKAEEAHTKNEKLEESELSEEEKPKKTKAVRRKVKAPGSDHEDDEPKSKAKSRIKSSRSPDRKRKEKEGGEPDEDTKMEDLSTIKGDADVSEDEKPSVKKAQESDEEDKDKSAVVDEEDEYSDVIDEGPKPKRKKAKNESVSKSSASAKASKPKSSAPDDSAEGEIKKLQAQLVKCGVRKLWHNELKRYGNDSRAKIRHLKKMLTDVGMDGRFSEAKAREIKETRELLAEAEAAQEMNNLWGTGSEGRASRSKAKAKSMKVDDSDDSDAHEAKGAKKEEDDEDDEDTTFAARRRARADLAFLGDDSDSD